MKGNTSERATGMTPLLLELNQELRKEIFADLPMVWRAMCCRVCKVWQQDVEQPQEGHGDDILVDYGLVTLCSVLATKRVDEVMRRIHLHNPSGIAADLGRMDQVRRFVQRYYDTQFYTVDMWMQLASQEPDAGWLCKGMSKTNQEWMGKSLMTQNVGKPQNFSNLLHTLGQTAAVYSVAYSHDGITIAISDCKGKVSVLDAKTMEEKGTLKGHSDIVACVAYSPDSKSLASAGYDSTVKLWDLSGETPVEKGALKGHSREVKCVTYSPNGKNIASASFDRTVKIWDAETKQERLFNPKCPVGRHGGRVTCVTYSPDGTHVASASFDTTVKVWDAETKQEVFSLDGNSGSVRSVAWSPDGEMIAYGTIDNYVFLWSKTGEHMGTLNGDVASWQNLDPETKALAAKVTNDYQQRSERTGQYIVTTDGTWDGGNWVFVYRTDADGESQGEPLAHFRNPQNVTSVTCKGTTVVVGCRDGQVCRCLPCGANAAVF